MKETRSKSVSIPELKALARKHWEEWLPEKVKELRAEGKLDEALHGAARAAQAQIDHLMRHLHYQEHEAREVALPLFILLPPEPEEDDEQARELLIMEAEYRRNPPPVVVADREREKEEDENPDYWKR
jgi:hypothetical protein